MRVFWMESLRSFRRVEARFSEMRTARRYLGKGVSVWLRADLELLWSRVRHKSTRPLLHTEDPKSTLSEIQSERDPVYALADLSVDADASYSIEDMTDAVIQALLGRPDVLEKQE